MQDGTHTKFKTQTSFSEIPNKLRGFDEFCAAMKQLCLQGTDKYSGAEKDKAETIDIIPQIIGEDAYVKAILGYDLVKRIIRFINQRRERDLFKMALWLFFIWQRLYYRKKRR